MNTQDILQDMVARGVSFTAYEVTSELRRQGERVRHNDVRREVQNAFANGSLPGYNRTQATTPAWSAVLYYPSHEDPALIVATQYGGVASAGPAPLPAVPATPAPITGTPTRTASRGVDGDGRVFVPPKFLEAIGVQPGDFAQFTYNPGELVITPGGSDLRRQGRGHFRINPRTLSKAGLAGKGSYQIDLTPGAITVR